MFGLPLDLKLRVTAASEYSRMQEEEERQRSAGWVPGSWWVRCTVHGSDKRYWPRPRRCDDPVRAEAVHRCCRLCQHSTDVQLAIPRSQNNQHSHMSGPPTNI